ncbi:hypothetical protein PR202_gb28332 [Eleusine coracana subsp. coracana]|uniref:Choline monooxygenase, chloroplastic n=1 Tax=Eleusine coracana subsp. coracana TaxID=191504 RepID=A0AAV5FW32_ELECO|nr:hypothetical protein PR202_gb28332 [Eleusine coracana subsp. coracana]
MATTARSLAAFSSSISAASRASRAGPPRASIGAAEREQARRLVAEFDPAVPLSSAVTPPSGWYTDPDFLQLELDRVFLRGWQAVGHIWQVKNPNDFFTGRLGNLEFIICRAANGKLHAFHNVCRHHASLLACGSGQKTCFQCPYHDFGLIPVKVATWGPFVLAKFDDDSTEDNVDHIVGDEWLGSASDLLSTNGIDTSLPHICRREYTINCNWKVFCDNYLDGGYHVPYAHGALASGLQLQSYETLGDHNFIGKSLKDSEQVQMEDIALCEGVQRGLESPAYSVGRYAPSVEMAMHHFHCLLHANLSL